jgi:hypothetical protein
MSNAASIDSDRSSPLGNPVPPARQYGLGALLFVCLFSLSFSLHAMWASLTDDELIKSSELIVMGEWLGETTFTAAGRDAMTVGVVSVSEVLKGAPTTRVVLIVQPSTSLKSSTDIAFKRGDRGLWLLRPQPNSKGLFLADHPQRFVPAATGQERIQQLRKKL